MKPNNDESKYERYEWIAVLLENNPGMTDEQAYAQAVDEIRQRNAQHE